MLAEVLRDFRYSARSLARTPGFTVVAVAVLALGIGATSAIFSLVSAVWLKPLPFTDADRVVSLGLARRSGPSTEVTPGHYDDWRQRSQSFEEITLIESISANLIGDAGEPERLFGLAARRTCSRRSVWRRLSTFTYTPHLLTNFLPLRRRSRHSRSLDHVRRPAHYGHRRRAARFSFPVQGTGLLHRHVLAAILSAATTRGTSRPSCARVSLEAARAEMGAVAAALERKSRTRGAVPLRGGAAARLLRSFRRADVHGVAGCGRTRPADRLRQRRQFAVGARGGPLERARDPQSAWRGALACCGSS